MRSREAIDCSASSLHTMKGGLFCTEEREHQIILLKIFLKVCSQAVLLNAGRVDVVLLRSKPS